MDQALTTLKSQIYEDYNKSFKKMTSVDISAVAEAVEKNILKYLEDTLYFQTNYLIGQSSFTNTNTQKRIIINDKSFKIRIMEAWEDPNILTISYLETFSNNEMISDLEKKNVKIKGIGKYKKVQVAYPNFFQLNLDNVLSLCEAIFEASYSWIFHWTQQLVRDKYTFSSLLYNRLKVTLTNQYHIYGSVWFVVKEKKKCRLLLDEENVRLALEKLASLRPDPELNPYELLDEFVNMMLEYNVAFARKASEHGGCIDGVITKGGYQDTLLAVSQVGIFSERVSVYPIITEGKYHLYASFPTKFKWQIKPAIDINKDSLQRDFKDFNTRLKKTLKIKKRYKLVSKDVQEVTGNIIGISAATFFKNLSGG